MSIKPFNFNHFPKPSPVGATLAGFFLLLCITERIAAESPANGYSFLSGAEAVVLHKDNFTDGLDRWHPEVQRGRVEAEDGRLTIDVRGGATVWFRKRLTAPVIIQYDVTVIDEGGPNDRVSDMNCFWMATDPRAEDGDFFSVERRGPFGDYHALATYYVGLGGHNNTRTRFRRYAEDSTDRPLLPEHDLTDERFLIEPNRTYRIELVADGHRVQYRRDGEVIFDVEDPNPYREGYFGFRTVRNRMVVGNFRVLGVAGRSSFRPALMATPEQHAHVRAKVNAGVEPWASTFQTIRNGEYPRARGDVNPDTRSDRAVSGKARIANLNAFMYYMTGEEAHARRAVRELVELTETASGKQLLAEPRPGAPLRAGPTLTQASQAAAYLQLAGYPGWTEEKERAFQEMAYRELVPLVLFFQGNPRANWWTLANTGMLNFAIHAQDRHLFELALRRMNYLIEGNVPPSGLASEVDRNLSPHSLMQLNGHIGSLQLAFVQGYDYFDKHADRFSIGSDTMGNLEYLAAIYREGVKRDVDTLELKENESYYFHPVPDQDRIERIGWLPGTGSHIGYYHYTRLKGAEFEHLEWLTQERQPVGGWRGGSGFAEFLYRDLGVVFPGGDRELPDLSELTPLAYWNFDGEIEGRNVIRSNLGEGLMRIHTDGPENIDTGRGMGTHEWYEQPNDQRLTLRNIASDTEFILELSTRGHRMITVSTRVSRSGGNDVNLLWSYSTDGGATWRELDTIDVPHSYVHRVLHSYNEQGLWDQDKLLLKGSWEIVSDEKDDTARNDVTLDHLAVHGLRLREDRVP